MVRAVLEAVLDGLFPLRCPGCGAPGAAVCGACATRLRAPVPVPSPPGIDAWASAFAYDGVARELVARVKYRSAHGAVEWLARAMAPLAPVPVPEVITWAPTTPARRRARGFDHAELLARRTAPLL